MKKNKTQRANMKSGFAAMATNRAHPSKQRFGGKNFIATEKPQPIMQLHGKCGFRLPKKIEKAYRNVLKAGKATLDQLPGCFKLKQAIANALVVDKEKSLPGCSPVMKRERRAVGRHRGTWLNTRHNGKPSDKPSENS